jgi:hypothetical protein
MGLLARAILAATLGVSTTAAIAWLSAVAVRIDRRARSSRHTMWAGAMQGNPKMWDGTPLAWQLESWTTRSSSCDYLHPLVGATPNEDAFAAALTLSQVADRAPEGAQLARSNPQIHTVRRSDGWPFLALQADWPWFGTDDWPSMPVKGAFQLPIHSTARPRYPDPRELRRLRDRLR